MTAPQRPYTQHIPLTSKTPTPSICIPSCHLAIFVHSCADKKYIRHKFNGNKEKLSQIKGKNLARRPTQLQSAPQ